MNCIEKNLSKAHYDELIQQASEFMRTPKGSYQRLRSFGILSRSTGTKISDIIKMDNEDDDWKLGILYWKTAEHLKALKKESKTKKASGMTTTFIDLFAGIGGFHVAFSELGAKCVFASEIDENARKTYIANHSVDNFAGDINLFDPRHIPDHDVLCAGFPCQPFSQAGFKKGFRDTRGTLFSNILDIMKIKKPRAFFLENVRHLKKHDSGQTFSTIRHEIENLGYSFFDYIVHAKDHGVPQLRPRLFMIGFRDDQKYIPPKKRALKMTMSNVLGGHCPREIGYTLRVGGVGSGINSRHNWDSYIVDGEVVRLTVEQGAKMQGLPKDFVFPVSKKEAMKQLGNSVAVPAIKDYAKCIMEVL